MEIPERIDIFGVKFSKVDCDSAVEFLRNAKFDSCQYVCFPSTDIIAIAYNNRKFLKILNNSCLTLIDGKITEYYARIKGYRGIKNVSGYWLMDKLLQTDLKHYFYGCDDDVLTKLKDKLLFKFPKAKILGLKAPPFITMQEVYPNNQIKEDFEEINQFKPDIIWVGISTPKQDCLMYNYKSYLDKGILIGVGAVFLYQAEVMNKGPEILKKLALRWLYKLLQEPKKSDHKDLIKNFGEFIKLIFKHDILKRAETDGGRLDENHDNLRDNALREP